MVDTNKTCPFSSSCHFFNIQKPTPNTEVLQEVFCQGEYRMCLIYRKRADHRPVPISLWPNGDAFSRATG